MWSDWLVFCECDFNLSALWCPLSVPSVLLAFLLPWMWVISSPLPQQSVAAAPYHGHGVSPPGHCPWPWTWGSSSTHATARRSWLQHLRCFTTLLLFIKYNSTTSELYVISTFWFIYIWGLVFVSLYTCCICLCTSVWVSMCLVQFVHFWVYFCVCCYDIILNFWEKQ